MTSAMPSDRPSGGAYALRGVVVATNLAELTGPLEGRHQLPLRLEASHRQPFDFSDELARQRAYEVVLAEAAVVGDVAAWVNGAELERLWPDLYLPRAVRQAWEEAHPRLQRIGAGPDVPQA